MKSQICLLSALLAGCSAFSSSESKTPAEKGLADLADMPIGIAVNIEGKARDTLNSAVRRAIVTTHFDQMSVENTMKMKYWDSKDFSNPRVDELTAFAVANNLKMHGHVLVWHRSYQLPSWAYDDNPNFLADFTRHVAGVAGKNASTGIMASWDVVNEALYDKYDDGDNGPNGKGGDVNGGVKYRKSVFYRALGPDYIAQAFKAADKAEPNADLYYNDFNTEDGGPKTDSLVNLIDGLVKQGVPIDGVGFQMHVISDYPSLDNIKASWRRILDLNHNLKIKITELDVRVNNRYDGNPDNDYETCNNCPGLEKQKARYKEIVKAYYEVVPAKLRGGITIWGVSDTDSWYGPVEKPSQPDWPLLWDGNLKEKPAFYGVKEAIIESE